ncbi:hypothetical protein GGX14DRAFT_559500 [Mycena pura]|uniref:Uncharacterized protein n=1 Tax=Mycena pura TaxID=153505 RepID=A0AAD6YGU3_9AGAR|nr:hypothetical protein GGX14DRAFT_559500 [Mycena pura]
MPIAVNPKLNSKLPSIPFDPRRWQARVGKHRSKQEKQDHQFPPKPELKRDLYCLQVAHCTAAVRIHDCCILTTDSLVSLNMWSHSSTYIPDDASDSEVAQILHNAFQQHPQILDHGLCLLRTTVPVVRVVLLPFETPYRNIVFLALKKGSPDSDLDFNGTIPRISISKKRRRVDISRKRKAQSVQPAATKLWTLGMIGYIILLL